MTNGNGAPNGAGHGAGGGDTTDRGNWADLAKITAAGTAFAGLLTALAVAGIIGRLERNHGTLFVIASGLVLASAGLWVIAALSGVTGTLEKVLQGLGVILLLAGLIASVLALVRTQHDPNRPSVSASLSGNKLAAVVEASGLGVQDRIEVHIDGLRIAPASQELRITDYTSLYWASVGADNDGNVKVPIALNIQSGRFDAVGIRAFTGRHSDCLESRNGSLRRQEGPGCVIMLLPQPPVVPALTTSWHGRALTTRATIDDAQGEQLLLTIDGYRRPHQKHRLLWAHQFADRDGNATISETVEANATIQRMCVSAIVLYEGAKPPKRTCSSTRAQAAEALLNVPSR